MKIDFRKSLGAEKLEDLVEISIDQTKDKKRIGTAFGSSYNHCWYLGRRHGKDFANKAKWYCYVEESDPDLIKLRKEDPGMIGISFYGEKE